MEGLRQLTRLITLKQLTRLRTFRRVLRARPITLLLSLFATVFFLFLLQWVYSIPPPKFGPQTHKKCRDGKEGYVLRKRAVCTDTCGVLCFPRVRGICFGNSQVTLCDDVESQTYSGLPNEMRFDMEDHRKKVPVRNGFCPGWDPDRKKPDGNARHARWIHGLHMVADLTLMPYGKAGPNPHHESEKVIPAILMSQLYGLKNATFYWFANPRDPTSISVWSKGLLKVFASQVKVEYLRPVMFDESPICFEDAIIFASMTNAAYIPNQDAHDWLRQKVLTHCKIPTVSARRPLSDAVAIHRPNSSTATLGHNKFRDPFSEFFNQNKDMDSAESSRNKCAACFKQFNKMEHLVEHMRLTCHSGHEPICGICRKHCKFFDSLREHLVGPLPKAECSEQFRKRGCELCLIFFDSPEAAATHKRTCQVQTDQSSVPSGSRSLINKRIQAEKIGPQTKPDDEIYPVSAVSLDCEMVGGGQDSSFNLCGKVCLVDEEENVLFQTYVKPQIPVTDYRYDITGIKPEHLAEAIPVKDVAEEIKKILYNGETVSRVRLVGGKAKLLVGHSVDNDLQCLMLEYPSHLIRDTAKYPPLRKTGKTSHSLKYLTKHLLGYRIQNGQHDPFEDAVAAMRLYKKMRSLVHEQKYGDGTADSDKNNNFASMKQADLEKMTPEALLGISRSDYRCWCCDVKQLPC